MRLAKVKKLLWFGSQNYWREKLPKVWMTNVFFFIIIERNVTVPRSSQPAIISAQFLRLEKV